MAQHLEEPYVFDVGVSLWPAVDGAPARQCAHVGLPVAAGDVGVRGHASTSSAAADRVAGPVAVHRRRCYIDSCAGRGRDA